MSTPTTTTYIINADGCSQHLAHAVSDGIWQGDIPLNFALPLLIIQIVIVLVVTRALGLLFKPLRQPRVLAEIIGGVLLGPSALGRNKAYLNALFPKQSLTIIDTIATMGLLFFIFMVGLDLDLGSILKTGRKSIIIAFVGILVPFVAAVGIASLLRDTLSYGVKLAPFSVFVGVPVSISAFGVLVRIMAELKILTTDIGQTVLPAAAINDLLAWILLALGVALAGRSSSPFTPVWVLLCTAGFVVFMMTIVRIFMAWIVRRAAIQDPVNEVYVCITLLGVLVAGLATDAIGVHPIFGALLFGLIIPKDGNFAELMTAKIEDFVTTLMLPLFFASSGLKTNLGTIRGVQSFGFLVLLLATASIGKICSTFLSAVAQKIPVRKALILGFLMNTKGLAELIILNIGKDVKVLNDETFAILVLMCLFTTFITTPAVTALYKPAKASVSYSHRKLEDSNSKSDLRILACVHGIKNTASMINLVEASRGTRKRSLRLYILHLMELSERPSTIMMVQRAGENGLPYDNNAHSEADRIFVAFDSYGKLSRVAVRTMTAISAFANMHEDICNTAAEKRAAIIILPFHKHQRIDGVLEGGNPGFRMVNQGVLQHAPCSVGIFIDRGLGGASQVSSSFVSQNIAMLFFGGPDDREALVFGSRMAEHPGVKLKVLRFLPDSETDAAVIKPVPSLSSDSQTTDYQLKPGASESYRFSKTDALNLEQESFLDEESLSVARSFKAENGDSLSGPIVYEEKITHDPIDAVASIAKTNEFNLFLVGRGRYPSPLIARFADQPADCSELGPIGDVLAGAGFRASVMVIQQYCPLLSEQALITKGDSIEVGISPGTSFSAAYTSQHP